MPAIIVSQQQGGVLGQDTLANAFLQANLALGQNLNVVTKSLATAFSVATVNPWLASDMIAGGILVHSGTFAGPITDGIDTATNIANYIQSLFPAPISQQPGNAQYPLQVGTIAQTGTPLALNGFQWKFRMVNLNTAAQNLILGAVATGVTYTSAAPGLLTMAQNVWRDFVGTLVVTGTNAAPVFAVNIISVATNAAAI